MIEQFGRKRCQKKRKDVSFALLSQFFQKYVLHMNGGLLKIRVVHTYVLKGFILVVSTVFSTELCDESFRRSMNKKASVSSDGD